MCPNRFRYLSLQPKHTRTNYTFALSPEQITHIRDLLFKFISEQQPFLKNGYCIRDLADDIKVPSYQISAFLNREIGMNFNDFMNQFRVKYCEDLMLSGVVGRLNLKGLALQCGFNNRNTLTTAFRKFTGLTPSEFTRYIGTFKRTTLNESN